MTQDPILECVLLGFAYPGGPAIVEEAGLSLCPGEMAVIQGPSGAGKSTFLRMLNRMLEPDSGFIRFQGKDLEHFDPPGLRKRIVYLQQTPVLVPGTIRENLVLPFSFQANHKQEKPSDQSLRRGLDELLLNGLALDSPVAGLSVGQRQRLCLLRALLLQPAVLLLDEPVSALDLESKAVVEQVVADHVKNQCLAAILVSHAPFDTPGIVPRTYQLQNAALTEVS